jgi:TonB-dependent SusC/RagA subfamily outer membrane receptor
MYNFYKENVVHLPRRSRIHQILRIMKLTTLILITVILHVSAATMAQKVTLVEKNAQLVDVFQQIHKQTGYDFLFTGSDLKNAKPVTINVKNEELADVLTKIFEKQSMDYTIENNTMVIKEKETSFIDNLKNKVKETFAQVTVTGKVQDETGQSMVGVTVKIKDSQQTTATDKNGAFSITAPNDNTVIVFSFIGYESQELRAKDITNGSLITLKATQTNLHKVVVSKGYYSERQELLTGNVSTVTAKQIQQQPVGNVLQALEGQAPGLLITQKTSLPGGGFNVNIRGKNSIANGTDPYYVVDGVPYPSQYTGSFINANFGLGNPLNFINPYDIESVEVLKDADATAIYGSRATNGAILITTKKGKAGTMKANFNINSGFSRPTNMLKELNTQQYLQMRREAFKNDGVNPALGVIDYFKYYPEQSDSGYIFPFLSEIHDTAHKKDTRIESALKDFNEDVKVMAQSVGWERKFTSYSLRHGFATHLRNNNVNISVIKEALGHDSESQTAIYLDDLDDKIVAAEINRALDFKKVKPPLRKANRKGKGI